MSFFCCCCFLSAGSRLSLRRVAGGRGSGLSGKRVHGAQELVGDAPGFPEAAEQGAVNCGGVVSDGVLAGEEEAGDGLRGEERERRRRKKQQHTDGEINKGM